MSNEETSMGSFHAFLPIKKSKESFRDSLRDSYAGVEVERKQSRLNRSRRSRHKPSYAV